MLLQGSGLASWAASLMLVSVLCSGTGLSTAVLMLATTAEATSVMTMQLISQFYIIPLYFYINLWPQSKEQFQSFWERTTICQWDYVVWIMILNEKGLFNFCVLSILCMFLLNAAEEDFFFSSYNLLALGRLGLVPGIAGIPSKYSKIHWKCDYLKYAILGQEPVTIISSTSAAFD